MRLFFVCPGNTCRSPMAEALARKALAAKGIEAYVESAGTRAERGVSRLAVEAMARRQLDIAGHEARPIQPEMVDRFDLILCMENHHRSAVMTLAPHAENKVFSLLDFLSRARQAPPKVGQSLPDYLRVVSTTSAGNASGIQDPMPEGTEEAYESIANQLDALLEELASLLVVLKSTR